MTTEEPLTESEEHQPYVANAFAIVGYSKLTPRDNSRQLSIGVELADPDVLFFYPVHDKESRQDLRNIIQLQFCRPDGFRLAAKQTEQPFARVHTLTKMPTFSSSEGGVIMRRSCRKYIAVMSFQEAYGGTNIDRLLSSDGRIFVPKFLVFISDVNMPDFFETCLGYFYTKFFVKRADVKYLNMAIAMLVCNVRVPCPGTVERLNFGDDRLVLAVQGPKPLPKSGVCIYRLFYQIGITFTVDAILCLLNEKKIVFYSKDVALLTDCLTALVSLLWPLSYNNIYAPVVSTRVLTDLLKTQPAFCVGVRHLSEEIEETFQRKGVVLVDLEQRTIVIPEQTMEILIDFEDSLKDQLFKDLTFTFSGKDVIKDWNNNGIISEKNNSRENLAHAEFVAKQLRACFLHLFAAMLSSYRRSMIVIRFFSKGIPQPNFYFDVANFLGEHNLHKTQHCLFLKLLESVLGDFFAARFPPFRHVDLFDELCANFANMREYNTTKIIDQIFGLLTEAEKNAYESQQILETVFHSANFPQPNALEITKNSANYSGNIVTEVLRYHPEKQRVPITNVPVKTVSKTKNGELSRKEWEFLASSLDIIFTKGIGAREEKLLKSLNWIKCKSDRRKFCLELSRRATSLNSRLDQRGFDCVTALAFELLEGEPPSDDSGIACALLGAVSNISCRSESSRRTEFLHEKLRSFDVWWNESLWLAWLSRFIASELVGVYNDQKPEIEKEPGKSMKLLTEMFPLPASLVKQVDEKSRIVQCCLACIDLMLSCLLQTNNPEQGRCLVTLATTVITKTALSTCLTNSQTQQLVGSIVDKLEINEDNFERL